jgi:hypothetical protein
LGAHFVDLGSKTAAVVQLTLYAELNSVNLLAFINMLVVLSGSFPRESRLHALFYHLFYFAG